MVYYQVRAGAGLLVRTTMLFALGVAVTAAPALAQGLLVRPSKFELSVRQQQESDIPFSVTNTASTTVDVEVVGVLLLQGPNGNYAYAEKNKPPADVPLTRSCVDWVSIAAPTARLAPLKEFKSAMHIAVPREARGSYASALLVRTKPTPGSGIRFVVQIVCPFIVSISGPPAQQRIELRDGSMAFVPAVDKASATTTAGLALANTGETYERVSGEVVVLRPVGSKWKEVTRQDLVVRGFLPGSAITLTTDLKRRLPKGRFKLIGQLRVGGLPRGTVEKVIEFAGDPDVAGLVDDVTLSIDPPETTVVAGPGSRRSVLIGLTNPSEASIDLSFRAAMPSSLMGVAMGDVQGPDLSAAEWTAVSPPSLTLRPGGQRSVRVVVDAPRDTTARPSRYAIIEVDAKYADGHEVSRQAVMVIVRDGTLQPELRALAMPLSIAHESGNKYAITAKFGNVGSKEFRGQATAYLRGAMGPSPCETGMTGPTDLILPLGTPQYSGVLDFGAAAAGVYRLCAALEYGASQPAVAALTVRVTDEDKRKVVTVLQDQDLPAEGQPPATEGNK